MRRSTTPQPRLLILLGLALAGAPVSLAGCRSRQPAPAPPAPRQGAATPLAPSGSAKPAVEAEPSEGGAQTAGVEPVLGGKPIPSGPGASVGEQMVAKLHAHRERVMLDAYRKVGSRSPKWDEAAIRYLKVQVRLFSGEGEGIDEAARARLRKEGEGLLAAGCTDPLVLLCQAEILRETGNRKTALLKRSAELFQHSGYTGCIAGSAAQSLALMYADDKSRAEQVRQWRNDLVTWTVRSATDGSYNKDESRVFLYDMASLPWQARHEAYPKLAAIPGADSYAVKTVGGRIEIWKAWQSRTGKWASDVSAQEWQGFEQHIAAARRLLTEAWQEHPEYPEAPTEMITMAMAAEGEGDETPRTWFDRAVAAQMDYEQAYTNMENALLPRWGGEHELMYQFGVECLQTGRFDTKVPQHFLMAVSSITRDLNGDTDFWTRPETYGHFKTLCEGYAKTGFGFTRDEWLSEQVAWAWRCERYDEAKGLMKSLGSRFDEGIFEYDTSRPVELLRMETAGLSAPYGPRIREAEALHKAGRKPQALALLQRVRKQAAADKWAIRCVDRRLADLRARDAFARGEWVNVLPAPEFAHWYLDSGTWKLLPDGSIHGKAEGRPGLAIDRDWPYGKRWEIRAEVEFVSPITRSLHAAVLFNYTGPGYRDHYTLMLWPMEQTVTLDHFYQPDPRGTRPARLGKRNTFRLVVNDTVVTSYVNGQPMHKALKVEENTNSGKRRLGLGGSRLPAGTELVYRKVQVRRLGARP